MKSYLFVTGLERNGPAIVVHCSNGGLLMPEVTFQIDGEQTKNVYIGKRYQITIEEADE